MIMGLEQIPWDEWFDFDDEFREDLALRKKLIEEDKDSVIRHTPLVSTPKIGIASLAFHCAGILGMLIKII